MQSGNSEFHDFAVAATSQLFRTALLLAGGDWHRAEDLVQDTLAKVYLAWRKIDKTGNPLGYAQTTLVRTFISQGRLKSSGESPTPRVPENQSVADDPTLRMDLLKALGWLAARERALLVLRYWEDRSVEEAASVLGMSSSAVRVQSKRALAKLRAGLGESFPELVAEAEGAFS